MASANPHKATEMAEVLREVIPGVEIVPRPLELGDVVEDGATLADNALIKARFVCAAAGEPAIADDTGLEVDALGGAPGVYSARYAGPEADAAANLAKLMAALADVPAPQRTARFRTVVAVVHPGKASPSSRGEQPSVYRSDMLAEGVVEGTIATERRGNSGFGYDPVFVPDEASPLTFAEMPAEAKNQISHRGRALRALAARLGV